MARTSTIVWLSIGLVTFILLLMSLMSGFAIWVFLPIMPAAIIFVFAVVNARRRAKKTTEQTEDSSVPRKAA